jgi:AcrR family transcriptional regulator/DNA-binding MarR family transcriptional regulator
MADVVCEEGLQGTTVADVVRRARVSRRTFYDLFEDRDDAFLAAFEEGVRRARGRIAPVFDAEQDWAGRQDWTARVRMALAALLGFFDEEPQLARWCVVHSLAAGPAVLARRTEVLRTITTTLDRYAREELDGPGPPALTAEGVVGGVLAIVHARLLEQDSESLVSLVGPLMGTIVLPYAGLDAASGELARPTDKPIAPPDGHASRRSARSPLEDLDMRLTYRTLRVLAAVAGSPGASNRDIADRAGVRDQGQMSKLLTRLERLELVHNNSIGAPKGEPNAWQLTPKGHAIEQATRTN